MSIGKVYISGGVTGSTERDAALFDEAEKALVNRGYEVVNPLRNGLPAALCNVHTAMNILLLIGCRYVYMLSDWECSSLATLEKNIADVTGKCIIYQSPPDFSDLKQAILSVTGVPFSDISGGSRRRERVDARMIFVHHCLIGGATVGQLAAMLNRDHSTITYYSDKYDDHMVYNSAFRDIAGKIENELLKTKNYNL
jgi:hypothetical protein